MQSLAVAAAFHETAGKFVDNKDFAVAHDVITVQLEQSLGAQRLLNVMDGRQAFLHVDIVHAQGFFNFFNTSRGQRGSLALFVNVIVRVFHQRFDDFGKLVVLIRGLHVRRGDNQRRTRFINQNTVDFIDDGVVQVALHQLLGGLHHVIAQIVESEFIVGAVGNVSSIRFTSAALLQKRHFHFHAAVAHFIFFFVARFVVNIRLLVLDGGHRQAQSVVHLPHPFRVALGQIVVDRDNVHALAGKGV